MLLYEDDMGTVFHEVDDTCTSRWDVFCNDFTTKIKALLDTRIQGTIKVSENSNLGRMMWNFHTMRLITHDYRGELYPKPYTVWDQIGCMALEPLNGEIVWSSAVQINKPWRGDGLGQQLLKLRIDATREFGFKEYWCSVVESNTRQLHILQKHNFKRAVEGQRIWRLVL